MGNLGHSNVILTAGGGAFGHKDGPKQGATSCRQGEEAWKLWKAGAYGDISLSDGVIEFAKTHEEIKGAFLTFQKDADQIYPGWKEASAAAAFVGATAGKKESVVARYNGYNDTPAEPSIFYYATLAYSQLQYGNDVGYFPDGTPYNKAGNAMNHP